MSMPSRKNITIAGLGSIRQSPAKKYIYSKRKKADL